MNADRLPSVPQMVARSLDGHRKALAAFAEGRPALGPTALPSEYRGMRTVVDTLYRWGCLQAAPERDRPPVLTARGTELLAALQARNSRV